MGAWIELKEMPHDAETEAYVGLGGPLLCLLLLLLVGPLTGEVGGLGRHIGGLLRHHGRLVRLLGPLPNQVGPLLRLVGQEPHVVRALLRAQPGFAAAVPDGPVPGVVVHSGFGVLAIDRVPGHAVGLTGLGHALPGGGLSRLVLSHDHFLPGGSARVCPPWMNGMTKARHH